MEIITYEYLPYLEKDVWIKYDVVQKSTEMIEPSNHRTMLWGRWSWARNEIKDVQLGYGRTTNNFTTQAFTSVLPVTHISVNSVKINVNGILAAIDNGIGGFTKVDMSYTTITGTINYNTGAISLAFTPAPPKSSVVSVDYNVVVDSNFNGEWVEFRTMAYGVRNS